ncbi:MAG: threonine synthase [Bacilli bacterium]|nr:threonine synthase [Bacilli bacterium]
MSTKERLYTSTRARLAYPSKRCIAKGISEDGGLFIPLDFDGFELSEDDVTLPYEEIAYKVFSFFLTDFGEDELKEVISKAYKEGNFKKDVIKVIPFGNASFLELYHGPTFAFKDMALTALPHLLERSLEYMPNGKKPLILTATSGDTGGAALSGFYNASQTEVVVLYPTFGVSSFQRKQMHYYENEHCHVFAVEGNFDDCQTLVKKVFAYSLDLKKYSLSSANSINIGRLIPQVAYYFASYLELANKGEIEYGTKVNYVVPTGNFGNILACYIAKRMGLFIDRIVCASNQNNVLTDFFETGIYDSNRHFYVTDSPAMDILVSSNLERLLYLASDGDAPLIAKYMEELKKTGRFRVSEEIRNNLTDFIPVYIDNEETIKGIRDCYERHPYLIDPHTSVAYGGYRKVKEELVGHTIIVSTASPYKFISAMAKAFKISGSEERIADYLDTLTDMKAPALFRTILSSEYKATVWKKMEMEEKLFSFLRRIDEKR